MNTKHKIGNSKIVYTTAKVIYKAPLFPRPVCLEYATMNIPRGYENDILMTLKAFSNETAYYRKTPHKLEGKETYSLDVKSRSDKYRLLFYREKETEICKITNLCTTETH